MILVGGSCKQDKNLLEDEVVDTTGNEVKIKRKKNLGGKEKEVNKTYQTKIADGK